MPARGMMPSAAKRKISAGDPPATCSAIATGTARSNRFSHATSQRNGMRCHHERARDSAIARDCKWRVRPRESFLALAARGDHGLGDRAGVLPCDVVPAHLQQLEEHPGAVAE